MGLVAFFAPFLSCAAARGTLHDLAHVYRAHLRQHLGAVRAHPWDRHAGALLTADRGGHRQCVVPTLIANAFFLPHHLLSHPDAAPAGEAEGGTAMGTGSVRAPGIKP